MVGIGEILSDGCDGRWATWQRDIMLMVPQWNRRHSAGYIIEHLFVFVKEDVMRTVI